MSFSTQLTDMYHFLHPRGKSNEVSLDFVYSEQFENYLAEMDAENFVKTCFVYGFEIRDQELNSINPEVNKLLELFSQSYELYEQAIEQDNKLKTIYNIGMINIYLYFCKKEPLNTSLPVNIDINSSQLPAAHLEFNITLADVHSSVMYLKKATLLANETIDIATGIYLYHTLRCFDYIFSVFQNYGVDNNGKPLDLDSFYVFSDQLDSETLWLELIKQMRNKYGVK